MSKDRETGFNTKIHELQLKLKQNVGQEILVAIYDNPTQVVENPSDSYMSSYGKFNSTPIDRVFEYFLAIVEEPYLMRDENGIYLQVSSYAYRARSFHFDPENEIRTGHLRLPKNVVLAGDPDSSPSVLVGSQEIGKLRASKEHYDLVYTDLKTLLTNNLQRSIARSS